MSPSGQPPNLPPKNDRRVKFDSKFETLKTQYYRSYSSSSLFKKKDETLTQNNKKHENAKLDFTSLTKSFSNITKSNPNLTAKEKLDLLMDSDNLKNELEAIKEEVASLEYLLENNQEEYDSQVTDYDAALKKMSDLENEKKVSEENLRKLRTRLKVAKDFYWSWG